MFRHISGKVNIVHMAVTPSTVFTNGALVTLSSGKLIPATSTTPKRNIAGVIAIEVLATDSDYALDRRVPVFVPAEPGVLWEHGTTGLSTSNEGSFYDITSSTSVNLASSTYNVLKCVRVLSSTVGYFELMINDVENDIIVAKEFTLSDTVWEDLRFPVAGINPPGAASDPARNTTTGLLVFSASATNIIAIQVQMPHSWKIGSEISPHIHLWYPNANAGNSVWTLQYQLAGIGDNFPNSFTTITETFAAPGVAQRHSLHAFDNIDMSSVTGVSAMIVMLLSRIGGDGADTYGAALPLLEFDIHYQIDSLGSRDEIVK